MATENQKALEDFSKGFEKDYQNIMQNSDNTIINQQWFKPGDGFDIFTLYNDKTPVVASSNTILISY